MKGGSISGNKISIRLNLVLAIYNKILIPSKPKILNRKKIAVYFNREE